MISTSSYRNQRWSVFKPMFYLLDTEIDCTVRLYINLLANIKKYYLFLLLLLRPRQSILRSFSSVQPVRKKLIKEALQQKKRLATKTGFNPRIQNKGNRV